MLRLIGRGGFGVVYEAKWKMKTVAAKMCGYVLEDISHEIKILTFLLPHSNVLAFYGVALSSNSLTSYIILRELASHGSLYEYLHVEKNVPTRPEPRLGFASSQWNALSPQQQCGPS